MVVQPSHGMPKPIAKKTNIDRRDQSPFIAEVSSRCLAARGRIG
jgi:hypothetical protein